MRRLPVYLLIDTSESMVGSAIESVRTGLSVMLSALRKNPYALEMGALSIITFGGNAKKLIGVWWGIRYQSIGGIKHPLKHLGG